MTVWLGKKGSTRCDEIRRVESFPCSFSCLQVSAAAAKKEEDARSEDAQEIKVT